MPPSCFLGLLTNFEFITIDILILYNKRKRLRYLPHLYHQGAHWMTRAPRLKTLGAFVFTTSACTTNDLEKYGHLPCGYDAPFGKNYMRNSFRVIYVFNTHIANYNMKEMFCVCIERFLFISQHFHHSVTEKLKTIKPYVHNQFLNRVLC